MRKIATVAVGLSVGALALWVNQARAGLKITDEVFIQTIPNGGGARAAVGSAGSARNSVDTLQSIGCSARQYVIGSTALSISCSARDATNDSLTCTSTNAALLPIIGAIGTDSRISFGADAAGNCTYIGVESSSKYAPKK